MNKYADLLRWGLVLYLIVFQLNAIQSQPVYLDWAVSNSGSLEGVGHTITTDNQGNTYVSGYYSGTTDFDPGPGILNLTAVGAQDIFVQKLDASGNLIWAKSIGGSSDDVGRSIVVDSTGSTYLTGYFHGTVDFDPGPATHNLTATGSEDIFALKLDALGNLIWAKSCGSTTGDQGRSIALGTAGNIYLTGYFTGTVDFDPGPSIFNVTSSGLEDVFVQKLDSGGDFLWTKSFGGGQRDLARGLALDELGNICVAGDYRSIVDFDPGSGTFNLSSNGFDDVFIQKLDPAGNFLWAKSFGGSGGDAVYDLTIDDSAHVVVTGSFWSSVDFDPGPATYNLTSVGGYDCYIQKLDSSGNFLWARSIGASDNDYGRSVSADFNGNVYVTGYFRDSPDFDPGPGTYNLTSNGHNDVFVEQLTPGGDFVWAQNFGSTATDVGLSIHLDVAQDLLVTGYFSGTVDFDPGTGTSNLMSAVGPNAFLQKLSLDCIAPDIAITATTQNIICTGDSSTLYVASGSLNDASDWHWYADSCGGTFLGTGDSITVSPLTTTDYFVRGEGGCIAPGGCAAITVWLGCDTIYTIAGTGVGGNSGDGGAAINAQLDTPREVVVDQYDNIFIADSENHRIRRVDGSTGIMSTYAGTGTAGFNGDNIPATTAQLHRPMGLCFNHNGDLLIVENLNYRVRKIDTTTALITTIVGTGASGSSGDGGAAVLAQLNNPIDIEVDPIGNIFISDVGDQKIRKVDTAGVISTYAGGGITLGDGGPATAAQLWNPMGIETDSLGNLLISDNNQHRVRKVDTSGMISTIAGTGTPGSTGDGGPAQFAQLYQPSDIKVDSDGNIIIANSVGHNIRSIEAGTGIISTIAGTGVEGYSGDGGDPLSAQLDYPQFVELDAAGNLFITDMQNHAIRKIVKPTAPPPPDPYNFSATPISQTQIDLSWTDISNSEVGFTIERSNTQSGPFTTVGFANVNDTAFSDFSGLTAGNTYYYRIAWVDSLGTNSAYSDVADATTFTNGPLAPANLIATAISSSSIALAWDDNSTNETGFVVHRAVYSSSYAAIDTVGPNDTSYVDSNLQASTAYIYKIQAYNQGGTSGFSNADAATTWGPLPTAPSGFVGTTISNIQINLSWTDNSSNETGFELQRSLNTTGPYVTIANLPANTVSYQDFELDQGTLYYYIVSATNGSGSSLQDSTTQQTHSTPIFVSNAQNLACETSTFCHQIEVNQPLNAVTGIDFSLSYDTNHYDFIGLSLAGSIANSTEWEADYYINPDQSVNASIFAQSGAPAGVVISGSGALVCLEFEKHHNHLSGHDSISLSPITLSYATGIEKYGMDNITFSVVKDSLVPGLVLSWNNLEPMLYNSGNPGFFLETKVFGASAACDTFSSNHSTTNMSGEFYHNFNWGEQVNIERDIDDSTVVMPFINGYDALLTKRIALGNLSFQPSINELLAADVNMDGAVTAGDVTMMRQRTTMKIHEFPQVWNSTSSEPSRDWLFVDSLATTQPGYQQSSTFPNDDGVGYSRFRVPVVSRCLPLSVSYQGFCPEFEQTTYYGVLLGDVNGNFQQYGAGGNFKDEIPVVSFDLAGAGINDDCQLRIPFYVQGNDPVFAVDFWLDYDQQALQFQGLVDVDSQLEILSNEFGESLLFTSHSDQAYDMSSPLGYVQFQALTDKISARELGAVATYANGDTAQVEVLGQFNCLTTGLDDILLFPNPTDGNFSVYLRQADRVRLRLFDMLGAVLWKKELRDVSVDHRENIQVSTIPKGVYMLEVNIDGTSVLKEIVVK